MPRKQNSNFGNANSTFHDILESMFPRTLKRPNSSFFLLGTRGTGKSTWLRETFKQATWFNLLDESLFQRLLVSPGLFYSKIQNLPPESWVVVDEIQRLPQLLNSVHRAIEEQRLNFALTGSSARKLKQAGINLLAGRAKMRSMLPLLPKELGNSFDIESILRYGSIPLIVNSESPEETLKDYVQLYIKEEIKSEALVRNLSNFIRSVPLFALYNGQILNLSSTARDAEVERKTLSSYLQILEDTLLVKKLHAFQTKLTVRENKKPKIYWIDPGLVRAAQGIRGPVGLQEKGPLLELYVFQIIRDQIENHLKYDDVFYWSPSQNKTEVDFLIRKQNELFAVEVKSTLRIRPDHFKGLNEIKKLPEVKRRIILYLGEDSYLTPEGIEIMTLKKFADEINKGF
ncbi:MAG: ATPase [Bdellovibrionaceae bacterium]|nr:ATPase [Pseudobdellovibrionaceae bacterium]|tara:strand:- start:1444 stop:2646 length:1203 start_codon:yes stop_codon:yes gene_type:complete